MKVLAILAVLALIAGSLAATVPAHAASDDGVIRVPTDEKTIQGAVDASKPGTLILVSPGVYKEAVVVGPAHKNIVIRGLDRATTIVDGELSAAKGHDNGFLVQADGVAIENITARNFVTNGFYWTGVDGYRGSYLTAIRNGDYGIFAFDSTHGQFDHSYASGSPDAAFYIGQCYPCDALIVDVEGEWNGIGYSGTNSGGNLVVARSSFHDNRIGIVPNSETGEANPPQRVASIVGNHVYDNDNDQAAGIEIAQIAGGSGILVAGGRRDTVERNLVTGHPNIGIGVIPLPEKLLDPSSPTARNFDALENTVRSNVLSGNTYDLFAVTSVDDPTDGGGNCFSDNVASTTVPADLQQVLPCGAPASAFEADVGLLAALFLAGKPPAPTFDAVALPDPPALANMPRAKKAAARPATHEPSIRISVKTLRTPTG
jgi:hypothetical protein